jgi:hypothetical protein
LFQAFFYQRKTLSDLALEHHRSRQWIQERIHAYEPHFKTPPPSEVILVIDATYLGSDERKFGLLVAKDASSRRIVDYRFIHSESIEVYRSFRAQIEEKGFRFQAVTIDGRRGIRGVFGDIPVQMCHFHQQAILTRYLTRNPKHPAAIDLKSVAASLGKVSSCRFRWMLEAWKRRHNAFLEEKSYHEETKRWHYTHKRLRSAFRSLNVNLPYLFTYKEFPRLPIPNTTNLLDGGLFSPLKELLKIHRGIRGELKKKLIVDFLQNHGK